MQLAHALYRAKRIVNAYKHVDGAWFWTKYSAYPYIGCSCGCHFCYCRGGTWLGKRSADSFDQLIQVKTNADTLLDRALQRLPVDVIAAGDWQDPTERKYGLSRKMLEVVQKRRFPLLVIERSTLLLRDLDLMKEIRDGAWACVVVSMGTVDPEVKRIIEPRSSSIRRRLGMMQDIADAGILVGTAMMPTIPIVGDSEKQIEDVVAATSDHGGQFVLAGSLTMEGQQAERSLAAVQQINPDVEDKFRAEYRWREGGEPRYGPTSRTILRLARKTRESCEVHGLKSRIPRYLPKGRCRENKRIAEQLFCRVYDLELESAHKSQIWKYRKAAWTVDEMPRGIDELFRSRGEAGLAQVPNIPSEIAAEIGIMLSEPRRP